MSAARMTAYNTKLKKDLNKIRNLNQEIGKNLDEQKDIYYLGVIIDDFLIGVKKISKSKTFISHQKQIQESLDKAKDFKKTVESLKIIYDYDLNDLKKEIDSEEKLDGDSD